MTPLTPLLLRSSCLYLQTILGLERRRQPANEPRFCSSVYYALVYREEEREMSPLCLNEGIGLIPWSPLARGFLAGNRQLGGGGSTKRAKNDPFADEIYFRPNDFEIVDRTISLANQLEVNPAQIALSWLLHKPAVRAPIVGVSRMAHLEDAVTSLEIKLDATQMAWLEEPYQPHPVVGHE